MKRKLIRNRKMRFASITAALTAMVVVVTVLANVLLTSIAERYSLYTPMLKETVFDVSDECYALLDTVFAAAEDQTGAAPAVKLLFCDVEENVKADDSSNFYLYHTVNELVERYDNLSVEYLDVIANPDPIKEYTTMENPLTGEELSVTVTAESLIVIAQDYHRVYGPNEFFAYDASFSEAWGYMGEKKLTSALMLAIADESRTVGLLSNHGEVYYDYELVSLLSDAGYTVLYLDLYKDPIPDDCELLISYNPATDLLTSAQMSDKSEVEILDEFLSHDGHNFLVFLDNATPSLPNLEAYLQGWGVESDYHRNAKTGVSHRYMIKDPDASLTSDGYTIYAEPCRDTQRYLNPALEYIVFERATSLSFSGEGYRAAGNGTYVSADGKRVVHPLYQSAESAEAWANGTQVDGGEMLLMTMTEQDNGTGGRSGVGVIASVKLATHGYVQSAVYGNGDVLLHLLEDLGAGKTTEGLIAKPFLVQTISTVTTSQALAWTLSLTLIPAGLVLIAATGILLSRRYRR